MEVKHILQTGLQVQPISMTNALPHTCASQEAMQKKAVKVSSLDHETIMEETSKSNRMECEEENKDKDKDVDDDEDEDEDKDNTRTRTRTRTRARARTGVRSSKECNLIN